MTTHSKRLELLDKKIAAGGDDPFLFYARALELRSLGQLEDALAAFDEVAERYPSYVPTFLMAGQLATELDRTEDARNWLSRGLKVAIAEGDEHARSELSAALDTLE